MLVIIVIALVGAGAYFVSTKQITPPTPSPISSPTTTPSPISTPIPKPSPTPTPIPEPTTIKPEDPNTLGFAKYPDYSLDSIPSTPVSVKYVVEHRSALDGKTITVRGIVVGIVSKEAACPPDRGACGAPMIFLADTAKEDRDKYLDLGIMVSEEEKGYMVGKNTEVKVSVSGAKTAVYLVKVY